MPPAGESAPPPGLLRITQWSCLSVWWLTIGLGIATIPSGDPRSFLLLVIVACLFIWRCRRRRSFAVLPDPLMFALPLLWAANATNGFLAWWPGLRWPYGVAALAASLDVLLRPAARNPWKFMDLWAGPILAIGWVVLFASFLREVFPLFSPSLHDRVMHACMVYSGGLLIGQAAWGTYLEGE